MPPIEPIISPPKGSGKGWGDGAKVAAWNKRRMTNPENTYTAFRPRVENEGLYFVIRNWAADPRVNKSFSAIINSLLEGLKTACENTTEKDEHGRISIEVNLGRIYIE